ncbi:sulfatase-like hydrolase/transferase [bacterium]|nr:sulfatase-like hydrolase/transferase [bacterium]
MTANKLRAQKQRQNERPNIIFIFTDQQQAGMMSCAGNQYLHTPAMDSLAATGVRFEKAYCTNPVCLPARFSMMTGRMPSELGIRSNDVGGLETVPAGITKQSMGWLLRHAGYDVGYGGKVHLPKGMNPEAMGFDSITTNQREGLSDACLEFVRRERDKPFLLVASFINPHDICYMAINDYQELDRNRLVNEMQALDAAMKLPEGVSREDFFAQYCPPLPPNFEPQEQEPEAIRMILEQRLFKKQARETWPDEKWRMHRWAYCRLTEMVDAHIGKVLDAVRESGLEENTLIIFSSDHGDLDSAHRMEHKTALYEEPTRVPLVVTLKGVTPPGFVNNTHLVSNGLDLIPTLCDYAGIETPDDLTGQSFRPLAEGRAPQSWRTHLWLESEFGYMLRSDQYKYILYDAGENREQLIDLEKEPWEMKNFATNPAYREIIEEYRECFQSHRDMATNRALRWT